MRKTLATLASCSLIATLAATGTAPATAATGCEKPTKIVSTQISPRTVVLGVSNFKGIVITVQLQKNGCKVDRVEVGLYGPNFIDSFDLEQVGTENGITTYDTGLRITPGDLPDSEAGTWQSFVSVWGQETPNAAGPNFKILRASRLTTNASPEPVHKGKTLTVSGHLDRASWNKLSYAGYGKRSVQLQWRSAKGSYHTVKKVTSTKHGDVKTTVKATQDGCFRYVFAGSGNTAPVTSKADCVDVR
jgi:hypothetical protein